MLDPGLSEPYCPWSAWLVQLLQQTTLFTETSEMQHILNDFATDLFIPLPQCERIEQIVDRLLVGYQRLGEAYLAQLLCSSRGHGMASDSHGLWSDKDRACVGLRDPCEKDFRYPFHVVAVKQAQMVALSAKDLLEVFAMDNRADIEHICECVDKEQLMTCYIEGLCWVLQYYYQGCCDWRWFFPYHYGPMLSDLRNLPEMFEKISFTVGKPILRHTRGVARE